VEHVGEGSGLMPMVYCLVRVLLTLSPQVRALPFLRVSAIRPRL
jgi:hypothetical protein